MTLGATLSADGADFAIWSATAEKIELRLFDTDGITETARHGMIRDGNDIHRVAVPGISAGQLYGFCAHGPYDSDKGLWFDPSKLLVDPYAKELDGPFQPSRDLSKFEVDTTLLVPKAIVTKDEKATVAAPLLQPGGLVYEVAVRPFTILHPDVPDDIRGTVAALAHPAILSHLKEIGVDAIEMMPITAWVDERHLAPLGLTNGWGYNPIAFMALYAVRRSKK